MDLVWRPGQIGPLQLPHRLVMGSMHLGLEGIDPSGAALTEFYRQRAAGGAGLIVTGGSAVSQVGAGGRNYSFVNDENDWPKLEKVASAVHAEGGRVLLQLFHAGRYAYERSFGLQPVAPSAVYSALSRCEPRELSEEEILSTVEDFASGAARARELGFDGVEIMGSEGYLLNEFMAPATNLRSDEWGGDVERRMRFPVAVASAVREAGGSGFAVVYRLSGVDLVDDGTPAEDVLALGRRLASGPVDALNVGIGWHEARVPTVQSLVPVGAWAPWVRAVREVVEVPVIASNRLNSVEAAEAVLRAGDADFISMARPFLADPEIVSRSRAGSRVNVCIACNTCVEQAIMDRRVSCVVNPRAGFELDDGGAAGGEVGGGARVSGGGARVSGGGARVAVVGGGPAGMEAARSLAVAGYSVSLFEARGRIGGQFAMAGRIPGKAEFLGTISYFEEELGSLGVDVSVDTRVVDAASLEEFDAVVVATGVVPRRVSVPGVELSHVISYADLLLGEAPVSEVVGSSVAIIGAGGIGVDVAHLLCEGSDRSAAGSAIGSAESVASVAGAAVGSAAEAFYARYGLNGGGDPGWSGRAVTLMRRGGRIGDGVGPVSRWAVVQELEMAGVTMLTGVSYTQITADGVEIVDASGVPRVVEASSVVIAAGQEPSAALAERLAAAGVPHVVIGGSLDASGLDAGRAFRQGFEAPEAVARALAAV